MVAQKPRFLWLLFWLTPHLPSLLNSLLWAQSCDKATPWLGGIKHDAGGDRAAQRVGRLDHRIPAPQTQLFPGYWRHYGRVPPISMYAGEGRLESFSRMDHCLTRAFLLSGPAKDLTHYLESVKQLTHLCEPISSTEVNLHQARGVDVSLVGVEEQPQGGVCATNSPPFKPPLQLLATPKRSGEDEGRGLSCYHEVRVSCSPMSFVCLTTAGSFRGRTSHPLATPPLQECARAMLRTLRDCGYLLRKLTVPATKRDMIHTKVRVHRFSGACPTPASLLTRPIIFVHRQPRLSLLPTAI